MSAVTLADFLALARTAAADTGGGRENSVRGELLGGVNGTNTQFESLYFPIVASPAPALYQSVAGGALTLLATPAAYTVDLTLGRFVLAAAPANGDPIDVLQLDYRWQGFSDDDWCAFVLQAARACEVNPDYTITAKGSYASIIQARTADVLTRSDDRFHDAMINLAAAEFCDRRSVQYADRLTTSSGGTNIQAATIARSYGDRAKRLGDKGLGLRDDVYKRRGRRDQPASAVSHLRGVRSYQPPQ